MCLVTLHAQFLYFFLPCSVTTSCSALGEDAGDSGVPARGRIRGRRFFPFFLIGFNSNLLFFQNKPFCTFGQNVATFDCHVRSSYPQLHGIVNLIRILQGGLEFVLLTWRTFPLTDLHSAEHLCLASPGSAKDCDLEIEFKGQCAFRNCYNIILF